MRYYRFVTATIEHETMTGMGESVRQELAGLADAYEQAPVNLRAAIYEAAQAGNKPAEIARAIRYVMTYDYVAKLIREDRAANPGRYPQG